MPAVDSLKTFGSTPVGSKAPDSITLGGGSIFVEYGNGAESTGASGSSTIVQYDMSGQVQFTYSLAGSVDGLKFNPVTGKVWALQNQDGNSTLSIIDPVSHVVGAPLQYANPSAGRGYDDVVFKGNRVFFSYTNPAAPSDPTLVELVGGQSGISNGNLLTTTLLTQGSIGTDLTTGLIGPIPQIDPDSLKLAPNGDLTYSSGDGGVIIQVANPGETTQSVSFTPVSGVTAGAAGLDDVVKPSASSGTFYVADATGNRVVTFHATGLDTSRFYGSVANVFGEIDPATGAVTTLVSNTNEAGFGASHGVGFIPDAPIGLPTIGDVTQFGVTPAGLKSPDSITIGGNSLFAVFGNGADSTGLSGSSTIIQYDLSGKVQFSYTVAGSVDGLKFNPVTGQVWALQNQDGNSKLSVIDPIAHSVSAAYQYANASATRGFDDVVFKGTRVFLSYTHAAAANDATIVELVGGQAALQSGSPLMTTPVLTFGATSVDTTTGIVGNVPQIDPDSLKVAQNGDLIFSSGDGGVIIDVKRPGEVSQSVSFTPIKGVTAGAAGLDDVIMPVSSAGTFYVADASGNRIATFHATGLNTNDYYGSVGGAQNAFGQIDPTTGAFTALVSNINESGFGSPHGLTFVADVPANQSLFGSVTHDVTSAGGNIYALYDALLGRAPDSVGFESAVANTAPLATDAQNILGSAEYSAAHGDYTKGTDDSFVQQLYQTALHRPGDAAGIQTWDSALASGTSRAQVAVDFAVSSEHQNEIAAPFQSLEGVFVANAGDSAVARLYYGLLNRAPDSAGLANWESFANNGGSLTTIASQFLGSAEYAKTNGTPTDSQFVAALYQGALGRGEDAGAASWTNALAAGVSRATVAVGIAESSEATIHQSANIENGFRLA